MYTQYLNIIKTKITLNYLNIFLQFNKNKKLRGVSKDHGRHVQKYNEKN